MNWTECLQKAINYIEENLLDDEALDRAEIAQTAFSSEEHFRKVFHIITGYTISEYIRNRRLSLAGEELLLTDKKIIDIALSYGYDSAESFTKAFTRFHGTTPSAVRKTKNGLRSFTRIVLKIVAEGGTMLNYQILHLQNLYIAGYSRCFTGTSCEENNERIPEYVRQCCRSDWNGITGIETVPKAQSCVFGYRDRKENAVRYTFGRLVNQELLALNCKKQYETLKIPDGDWACFLCGENSPQGMQNLWYKIYTEFLPFSTYNLKEDVTLECSCYMAGEERQYLLLPIKSDNG